MFVGSLCGILFLGAAFAAALAHAYGPALVFAGFAGLGVYVVLSAGKLTIGQTGITHRCTLGDSYLGWEEVTAIEIGVRDKTIVLHGDDKRLVAAPLYWSGSDKQRAVALFHDKLGETGLIVFPSRFAALNRNRNVRMPSSNTSRKVKPGLRVAAQEPFTLRLLERSITGSLTAALFGCLIVLAIWTANYRHVPGLSLFVFLGVLSVLRAGKLSFDADGVTHHCPLGTFRLAWRDVRRVEVGAIANSVILQAENGRLVLPAPATWTGANKSQAYALYLEKLTAHLPTASSSKLGDCTFHRNVRVTAQSD